MSKTVKLLGESVIQLKKLSVLLPGETGSLLPVKLSVYYLVKLSVNYPVNAGLGIEGVELAGVIAVGTACFLIL